MNLGLCLGVTAPGGGGGTPADPPSVVDSIQGGGSSSPQSGDTTLVATGSNRAGLVSVMSGTSRTWTSIAATITGTSSTRALTQDAFQYNGTNTIEAATQFVITEADYVAAGDGPYTIEVTATASDGAATKLGFAAVSIQDAPTAPTKDIADGNNLSSNVFGTRPAVDSLIIAAHGSSTASGSTTFTNATALEINAGFGDGVYMGWARQAGADITISTSSSGRDVFALYAFAPGTP